MKIRRQPSQQRRQPTEAKALRHRSANGFEGKKGSVWNGWAFREDDMKLEQHKAEDRVYT